MLIATLVFSVMTFVEFTGVVALVVAAFILDMKNEAKNKNVTKKDNSIINNQSNSSQE